MNQQSTAGQLLLLTICCGSLVLSETIQISCPGTRPSSSGRIVSPLFDCRANDITKLPRFDLFIPSHWSVQISPSLERHSSDQGQWIQTFCHWFITDQTSLDTDDIIFRTKRPLNPRFSLSRYQQRLLFPIQRIINQLIWLASSRKRICRWTYLEQQTR